MGGGHERDQKEGNSYFDHMWCLPQEICIPQETPTNDVVWSKKQQLSGDN
jgi:hypothetical protein